MATQTESFWTRLTASLRRRSATTTDRQPQPPLPEEDPLIQPSDVEAISEQAARTSPLATWRRRDQAIIQLQEGYEKVTRVVEEIQTHLAQQGERTERICGALEQIAQVMAESPQIARRQAQTLDTISAQLEAANARSQRLVDLVGEIPQAARAQSETLTGIGRQLEMSNEQAVIQSQVIDRLGGSLQTLGESSQTQGQILREMSHKAAEQSEQLARLIEHQGRRFMLLLAVTIVMALAAVAAVVVGLAVRP